jgi:hypothetical protein
MFSKVYFLKLWLPFAVITLFTTSLTVYSIALFFKLGFSAYTRSNGYTNSGIKKPDFLKKIGPLNEVYRVN